MGAGHRCEEDGEETAKNEPKGSSDVANFRRRDGTSHGRSQSAPFVSISVLFPAPASRLQFAIMPAPLVAPLSRPFGERALPLIISVQAFMSAPSGP